MDEQKLELKRFELQKLQTLLQLWNKSKKENTDVTDHSINEANKTEANLRNL